MVVYRELKGKMRLKMEEKLDREKEKRRRIGGKRARGKEIKYNQSERMMSG